MLKWRSLSLHIIDGLLILLLVLGIFANPLASLLKPIWFLDILTQFRTYWVACFLILALLFFIRKKVRCGVIAVLLFLFSMGTVIRYNIAPNEADSKSQRTLRAICYNVRSDKRSVTDIVKYFSGEAPDVLLLMEITPEWSQKLQPLRERYPYEISEPRKGARGIVLLSNHELEDIDPNGISVSNKDPYIAATVNISGTRFRFIGIHPSPPIGGRKFRLRNHRMRHAAELAGAATLPVILTGDFNCTPFSGHFSEVLKTGNLRDSALGYGFHNTWHRTGSWLPIDHMLVSKSIRISDRRLGPLMGSDHMPVIIDFSLDNQTDG